jgi:hypothetical protein
MKLKRLKDEYITVRKELYHRIEENNKFQHELVECRSKNDYYSQINNPQLNSLRSVCLHFFLFRLKFLFRISQMKMNQQRLFNYI